MILALGQQHPISPSENSMERDPQCHIQEMKIQIQLGAILERRQNSPFSSKRVEKPHLTMPRGPTRHTGTKPYSLVSAAPTQTRRGRAVATDGGTLAWELLCWSGSCLVFLLTPFLLPFHVPHLTTGC